MLRWKQEPLEPQRGWRPPKNRRRSMPLWAASACAALLTVLMVLLMMPRPAPAQSPAAYTVAAMPVTAKATEPSLPSCVAKGLPAGETSYTISFSSARLMAGRMMLVDETHPVPAEASAPNTFSILQRSGGRVACRDTQAVLAADALDALDELFRQARYARHNQLVVFAAARSAEQQRNDLIDRMAVLSRAMSFEEALAMAKREIELPGCSEHQLPWCVDIRLCSAWNDLPSADALQMSEAGQWLVENCWQYGFIRRYPLAKEDSHRAWHFRYVGKGHAAMMQALDATLEEYLALLRRYGTLTLTDEADKPVVTVLCQPMADAGETRFSLPLHGTVEDVSADNCGWAVASCLYQ